MATTKITDLTAYTDPVNTDVLPIVDVTSDVTKKVSIANVMKNASLGTAALPGIAFDGDPNTGIYSPGADQVAISTNGTGRLFVDSTGRVGVGTSSVEANVDIVGSRSTSANNTITDAALRTRSTSGGLENFAIRHRGASNGISGLQYVSQLIDSGSNGMEIYTAGSTPVVFGTNATERLRITSAGNVGVGTSSPSTLLHVSGGRTTLSSSDGYELVFARAASLFTFYNDGGNLTGKLSLTNNVGAGGGEIITFTQDTKRVGIGASSPDAKLEVVDTASSLTYPIAVSNFTDPATDVGAAVDFRLTTGGNSRGYIACRYTSNSSTDGTYLSFAPNDGSTGNIERMRITKAGLVGIGTTSPTDALHVANGNILIGTGGSSAGYRAIYFGSSTGVSARFGYIEKNNDSPYDFNIVAQSSTTAASTINFKTTPISTAATIDSSGRLLVGTSSWSANATVVAQGNSGGSTSRGILYLALGANNPADGTALGHLEFSDSGGGRAAQIISARDGGTWTSGSSHPGRLVFSTTADGASSPTERMRIKSAGHIAINNSTDFPGSGNTATGLFIEAAADGATLFASRGSGRSGSFNRNDDGEVVRFNRSGTDVGSIDVTSTATSYTTSSDYRLKENIVPVADGIARLQQLKPSRFNFIADPSTIVDGFIAHEVQAIVPEAIHGEKDEVDDDGSPIYQGIDQSKLVPLLTAALQEAVAKIETLEARLTALESA